ncbi:hypothetical protein AGMMS49921_09930 [Endomicrobiia bacterium]|nr:hypothetical protein AGMMS49921_09930 [Endomicrobiia bacterium]
MCIDNRTRNDFSLFKIDVDLCKERRKMHGRYYLVGLGKIHTNTLTLKKRSKKHSLTKEDKELNREISSDDYSGKMSKYLLKGSK